ncbi:hypothetical protein CDD83_2740 [Cordyceps sp. RAO-2017]|nr:hypothetical protein CDD83_2740 [Cordyceps sp. RAO-2017]
MKSRVVKRRKPAAATAKKAQRDMEKLLTSPKSALATADLRAILFNPISWDALDKADQDEILALFPDEGHVLGAGSDQARPNFASLMSDDGVRNDCVAYVDDLAAARHDPVWLADAWAAHASRAAGAYDDFLRAKFEAEWSVELPAALRPRRS